MDNIALLEFGSRDSDIVLLQPIDTKESEEIENEYGLIKTMVNKDFRLVAIVVDDWNRDLSPWKAPAVFRKDDFLGEANNTLDKIEKMIEKNKKYYLAGYSLAGLFSLWAAYQTDKFYGVAAISASVWFDSFVEYMQENEMKTKHVYLSLGDKEAKSRNKTIATVADKMQQCYKILKGKEIDCTFKWNEGNHFKDVSLRIALGFAWLINKEE